MGQPWYPFYWSDYSGKTMHLTQGQHGAYMLLLRWVYTTGGPVPHDRRFSVAQARLKPEQVDTDMVLSEFFERRGDSWHNQRAETVIAEAAARHKRLSDQGKVGVQRRMARLKPGLSPATSPAQATTTTTTTTTEKETKVLRTLSKKVRKPRSEIGSYKPGMAESEEALAYWAKHDRRDLNPEDQVAQFVDHHLKIGDAMADWPAAWRTWYRNAVKFNRKETGHVGTKTHRRSSHDAHFEGIQLLRDELQSQRSGGSGKR